MRTIVTILLLLLGLYLLYGVIVALFQRQFIFHPVTLPQNFQFKFDNVSTSWQEINVEAQDGLPLNALLFKADNPNGVIVFFHGNAGNLNQWGMIGDKYAEYGYHCLIWDYREFGKTKGALTHANLLEDGEAVYQYAKDQFPELPVIPYGVSIGTAPATHVAQKYQPNRLVLETPFFQFKQLAKTHFPGLPYDLLLRYRFDNYKAIKGFNGAVFMIHGTADQVIPYHHATALKDSFPEKVKLTTVPGADHNELDYHESYPDWLDEALNPGVHK